MDEWVKRIFLAFQNGIVPPGSLYDTRIEHDDWCAFLNGNGKCNCNPRIFCAFWARGHSPPDPPDSVFEINAEGESIPVSGQH